MQVDFEDFQEEKKKIVIKIFKTWFLINMPP